MNSVRRLNQRVARSYGPLLAVAMAFLLMAAVVPTADRAHETFAGNVDVPDFSEGTTAAPDAAGGTDGAEGGTTGGTGGAGGDAQASGGAQGGVSPCTDRTLQVPGDPYSPPCYAFSGGNGGSTYQGVTDKEILVTVRTLEGPSAAEIFADISGEQVSDSPEAYTNTVNALAEYFSSRFQMYGRKIKLVQFRGQGNGATELLGGGKEKALADAVRASKEHKAFADISAITIPYADALAQQKMVNIGSPYPSREWFERRRPYSWSLFPDGTNVVESSAAAFMARLKPGSTADYAGAGIKGKTRKFGIVAPENQEYQESVAAFMRKAQAAGIPIAKNMKYKLDLSSMPNQASNIVAQLKDAGITSVLCACDPVMLALGMTPKANEQGYEPEWITSGRQLIDQDQWSRAFGIAYNAESEPLGRSFPYAAFKQMRPNDEPAFGVEEIYYQLYLLAIGIQMAGPNLTPQTFEAGMFAYPGGSGPRGLWGFGPGDYTPTDDFREIWWDPNRISGQNNKPGAWVQLNGGARWSPRKPPTGPAAYFKEG